MRPGTGTRAVRGSVTGQPAITAVGVLPADDEMAGLGLAWHSRKHRLFLATKRMTDLILSLLGILILGPLMLLLTVAVRLTSSGPVIFRHRREGRGGKEFLCYKYRTMVEDAEQMARDLSAINLADGPHVLIRDDPRLTRLGRWLRNLSLDELPQLFNVLKGDMSLVGPRPSPFRENQVCMPWRYARLAVRPGITGLWQVCRSDREQGDFHQWVYYDIMYVRHMSLLLDLKIVLATFVTQLLGRQVPLRSLIGVRKYELDPRGTLSDSD